MRRIHALDLSWDQWEDLMFIRPINSTCHLPSPSAPSSLPGGHENYFPCLCLHYQIKLACSLDHRVMGTFATFTACLSIYLFIGNLLKLLLPQLFKTPNLLLPLSLLLCPPIAADPGVVCGQSVLPGVDGCVQASEVRLHVPWPQPEPALHWPQPRGHPPADAAQPGLCRTCHHGKDQWKDKNVKCNTDKYSLWQPYCRCFALWHDSIVYLNMQIDQLFLFNVEMIQLASKLS